MTKFSCKFNILPLQIRLCWEKKQKERISESSFSWATKWPIRKSAPTWETLRAV